MQDGETIRLTEFELAIYIVSIRQRVTTHVEVHVGTLVWYCSYDKIMA